MRTTEQLTTAIWIVLCLRTTPVSCLAQLAVNLGEQLDGKIWAYAEYCQNLSKCLKR
jgi:hypothetical protein